MSRSLHLSADLKTVVSRLLSDGPFKEKALKDPELAFAHYSLDAEERKALKSLMGHLKSRETIPVTRETFWL